MGRMTYFFGLLIFIDLMFIVTGQLGTFSPSSLIIGAVTNLATVKASTFWIALISTAGIGSLLTVAGVTTGIITRSLDLIAFVPMALTLSLLAGDFLSIAALLIGYNIVLGTFIMAPIALIYILVVVEWLRGKD